MEFPRQRVGFPLFTPPLPVPARKHETLTDSPGRKHELVLFCDSHHDLQSNPHHMTVLELPEGKLKCSQNTNVHADSVFICLVQSTVCYLPRPFNNNTLLWGKFSYYRGL